jgi:hypothetical protein
MLSRFRAVLIRPTGGSRRLYRRHTRTRPVRCFEGAKLGVMGTDLPSGHDIQDGSAAGAAPLPVRS